MKDTVCGLRVLRTWLKVFGASAFAFFATLGSIGGVMILNGGCASILSPVSMMVWLLQLWVLLTTFSALGLASISVTVVAVNSELFHSPIGARNAMVKVALSSTLLSGLAALGVLIVHLFIANEVPELLTLKDAAGTFALALPAQAISLHWVVEQDRRLRGD